MSAPVPALLAPNQFRHFYRGGRRIEEFRGLPPGPAPGNRPEDWVASTTTRYGQQEQGLSLLPDGRLLRDAVAADPAGWLGEAHVAAFGPSLELLVKLLDAGQRLIVHAHPDRAFSAAHLHCRHGKTEAWIVLATEGPDPVTHLGFRDDVPAGTLRRWVRDQDVPALLAALNTVPVAAGAALLVPAGTPHAIGAGVLLAELQEPTDFSVVLEWAGVDLDGPAEGHLGLGYDLALDCVDRSGWGAGRLAALRGPADGGGTREPVLPAAADPYFRAERVRAGARLPASVAVLVASSGAGELRFDGGAVLALARGDTAVVPHAAGPSGVDGDLELIRCLPPDPGGPRPAGSPAKGAP